MDNNDHITDRFFRERLSVFEELPGDPIWDKIVSRLETEKRRKAVYLFLRIAAGMTLLFSLGLGYHLVYMNNNKKVQASVVLPSIPEKAAVSPATHENANKGPENRFSFMSEKSMESDGNQPLIKDDYTTPAFDRTPALAGLNMPELALFQVPAPRSLGYRRLSKEELQEQTAALLAEKSESEIVDEEKYDRWMLGSEVAPLYSYRKIESDYLDNSAIKAMNNAEQGLLAYAGGLRVGYAAGRRLSVQSGIYYSRYGQEKTNGEAVSMDQLAYTDKGNVTYLSIPNSTGSIQADNTNSSRYQNVITNAPGNQEVYLSYSGVQVLSTDNIRISEEDITAIQYFDYIELPVTVKYKIIDRKLGFSFLGGLVTNFLVNNGVQLKQDGNAESFGTTRDINKVNYQGSVGLGFDYPVKDRLAISLEPRFRYYLNPIDQRFDVHPYSFGIFAGISYTFK